MQLLQRMNEYLLMDKHVKVAVNIKDRSVTEILKIVSCISFLVQFGINKHS